MENAFSEYAVKDGLIFGRFSKEWKHCWARRKTLKRKKTKTNKKWEIKFKSIDKTIHLFLMYSAESERIRKEIEGMLKICVQTSGMQSLIQKVQTIWKYIPFYCFHSFFPHRKKTLSRSLQTAITITHCTELPHRKLSFFTHSLLSIAVCHCCEQIPQ